MLKIEDIIEIRKCTEKKGYEIEFPDNNIIWMRKKRTIVGLLLLIKYGICSEEDLAGQNTRLQELKSILSDKAPKDLIKDRYGDANKPFSELWSEEGFSFIRAEGMKGNRQYVLDAKDHELLFLNVEKSERIQLSKKNKEAILNRQNSKCNICGSNLKLNSEINNHTFAKDRVKTEYDHRIPIDKGGKNSLDNFQALCHYCNKCKRQMCYICPHEKCNSDCALVSPETNSIVKATNEDISDRM
ncbi:HNH endonuclease [Romboutsia ilealis]|uniref:HNH endonuclease n=1 Tax=Romboutsia faecis TaxID=2764597 RepID=A0ABR7JTC1_9FIRM|nr:HNH endonuclease signature motif containing protein [Romboutsia faecis]MBC5998157.1 HNH endonuclease [Romboutsia faecis]MRN25777.1 HNH endonuclease [Romboutsia ilealis]